MKNGMITDKDGTRIWYHHGLLHRTDGPAMERNIATWGWWLDGVEYSFTDWLERNTTLDLNQRLTLTGKYK